MEKEETEQFKVVVTRKAEIYFFELAEFMYKNMGLEIAEEVITELQKVVNSLSYFSNRGAIEKYLKEDGVKKFRYLLVKRTAGLKSKSFTLSANPAKPFSSLIFSQLKRM